MLLTALFARAGLFRGLCGGLFLNRKFWPYMAVPVALLVTALFQMLGPVIFPARRRGRFENGGTADAVVAAGIGAVSTHSPEHVPAV